MADPRIATLQNQAGSSGELIYRWEMVVFGSTSAMKTSRSGRRHLINTPRCQPSAGLEKQWNLKDTRLTWVVGSAIRTATASSPDAVGCC